MESSSLKNIENTSSDEIPIISIAECVEKAILIFLATDILVTILSMFIIVTIGKRLGGLK